MSEPQPFQNIPLSRSEVIDALADELTAEDRTDFRSVAELLVALFHHEFHADLEKMKAYYAPFNPDDDGPFTEISEEKKDGFSEALAERLSWVLEKGNYRALKEKDVQRAFRERSLFPIEVSVDFDAYDDFVVYARGQSRRAANLPSWLGLRQRTVQVDTFDRVCLYIRFKTEAQLGKKQRKALTAHEPGTTLLKLFRNIPIADLEMLFPNTRLKMRLVDKLVIGVPAVVGSVPVAFKLAPAVIALMLLLGAESDSPVNEASLIAGLSGLIGLGIFLFRQWDKFKNRKVLFMKMLSENLYFRNLDNNAGVLTHLVDEAEEEESKEALCAYCFLLRDPGRTARELDKTIERWFSERFSVEIDFDVEDALHKLERLGLAACDDDGGYRAVGMLRALTELDRRWDEVFPFNNDRATDAS